MDSTRSLGVSQGPVPGSSEKGNSCANSALLGRELEFLFGTGGDVRFWAERVVFWVLQAWYLVLYPGSP